MQIMRIKRYEEFISILKFILRIKNTYIVNSIIISNGTRSFSKKDKKCITYLFFVTLKINENNK